MSKIAWLFAGIPMHGRKIFCAALILAGTVAVGAPVGSGWFRHATMPRRNVMVIYVGAADCAPCKSWEQADGAVFRASAEFSKISYREVKAPSTFDLLKDQYWPDDLRSYRDRLREDAGVPLWFVVADDDLVEQRFGESQWNDAVLPALKALLR